MSDRLKNNISEEGMNFILDLNMYLVSTGKSEKEIKEFIDEAEQHLIMGEADGKSVKDIFGLSPEEYAKSVAKEMDFDKKELLDSVLIFILGIGAWVFLQAIKHGELRMSFLEAVCIPLIYIVASSLIILLARKLSFKSDKIFTISIFVLFFLQIISFVVLELVGKNMEQSIVVNRIFVNGTIIVFLILSIIVSKKIEVWYLMMPFICYFPSIIESFFSLDFGDNLAIKTVPLIICIILCVLESKRVLKDAENE